MIKDFVEYMVKSIVEKPEAVFVQYMHNDDGDYIEITVDQQDRGKVIGREGQTIKALRVLVNQCAPENKKITVDLIHASENI